MRRSVLARTAKDRSLTSFPPAANFFEEQHASTAKGSASSNGSGSGSGDLCIAADTGRNILGRASAKSSGDRHSSGGDPKAESTNQVAAARGSVSPSKAGKLQKCVESGAQGSKNDGQSNHSVEPASGGEEAAQDGSGEKRAAVVESDIDIEVSVTKGTPFASSRCVRSVCCALISSRFAVSGPR